MFQRSTALVLALTLIGFTANANTYSDKQIKCLAQNIYYEARGEPLLGQLAVALVALNRVEDPRFPSTPCKVVWQPGQFVWTAKIKSDRNTHQFEAVAELAVKLHAESIDVTRGALYFNRGGKQAWHTRKTTKIGKHSFFQ
jgi:spore germination cell wall hydrolase CwlJ-like protein